MFKNTLGKGFHMKFPNNYTISVQWGVGNYCENYTSSSAWKENNVMWGSKDAEIAIFHPDGEFFRPEEWTDDILGYQSTEQVLFWMNFTANL